MAEDYADALRPPEQAIRGSDKNSAAGAMAQHRAEPLTSDKKVAGAKNRQVQVPLIQRPRNAGVRDDNVDAAVRETVSSKPRRTAASSVTSGSTARAGS